MEALRRTRRIGNVALAAAMIFAGSARADDPVTFTAQVDREQLSQEESVTLKLGIRTDGNVPGGEPTFNAPDFEVVNEYQGTFVESYYDNGRFGMRNNRSVTKVLKPTR